MTDWQLDACMRQYGRLVLTICLTFTRNYFDAEDLAQETFLAVYRRGEPLDSRTAKAYLCAAAANKCRDFLKSPARRAEPLDEKACAALADSAPLPGQALEERETERRLRRLCGCLREPYRAVAAAYFCEGKKLSELALATGESIKTLQTRLYRAKKQLRALWEEERRPPPFRTAESGIPEQAGEEAAQL